MPEYAVLLYVGSTVATADLFAVNRSESITVGEKPHRLAVFLANVLLGQHSPQSPAPSGHLTRERTTHLTGSKTPQVPGAVPTTLEYNEIDRGSMPRRAGRPVEVRVSMSILFIPFRTAADGSQRPFVEKLSYNTTHK